MLGNADLSLEWVGCGRKICSFERVPRRLFIFLLLLCDSYWRSAPFRLNAPRRLLLFDLKYAKENSGGAVLINCVFSSCVVPESVGFVSWSVCACVIFGASSRGRGLWGCIKGLSIKKFQDRSLERDLSWKKYK